MFGDLENQCRRPQGPVSLFVGHLSSEEDCAALPWLQRRLTEGQRILAADLRGTGQSFPNSCGSSDMLEPYGADYLYASFGSMMGESYLGRRVLDLLRTIDCLEDGGAEVHLIGRGVGSVPVALAALLHSSQPTCELVHYLPSYQLLIDNPLHNWPLSTMVENCLKTFDLPDIYAALGARLQKCDPWGPLDLEADSSAGELAANTQIGETEMSYRDADFLRNHIGSIIAFYHPTCIDEEYGGFVNQMRDDGSVFDRMTKHLVGTCRFVYCYSMASLALEEPAYRDAAAHGLRCLQEMHRQADGGFAWVLHGREVEDGDRHCYGHAFVLLAAAAAAKAGVDGAAAFASEVTNCWKRASGSRTRSSTPT